MFAALQSAQIEEGSSDETELNSKNKSLTPSFRNVLSDLINKTQENYYNSMLESSAHLGLSSPKHWKQGEVQNQQLLDSSPNRGEVDRYLGKSVKDLLTAKEKSDKLRRQIEEHSNFLSNNFTTFSINSPKLETIVIYSSNPDIALNRINGSNINDTNILLQDNASSLPWYPPVANFNFTALNTTYQMSGNNNNSTAAPMSPNYYNHGYGQTVSSNTTTKNLNEQNFDIEFVSNILDSENTPNYNSYFASELLQSLRPGPDIPSSIISNYLANLLAFSQISNERPNLITNQFVQSPLASISADDLIQEISSYENYRKGVGQSSEWIKKFPSTNSIAANIDRFNRINNTNPERTSRLRQDILRLLLQKHTLPFQNQPRQPLHVDDRQFERYNTNIVDLSKYPLQNKFSNGPRTESISTKYSKNPWAPLGKDIDYHSSSTFDFSPWSSRGIPQLLKNPGEKGYIQNSPVSGTNTENNQWINNRNEGFNSSPKLAVESNRYLPDDLFSRSPVDNILNAKIAPQNQLPKNIHLPTVGTKSVENFYSLNSLQNLSPKFNQDETFLRSVLLEELSRRYYDGLKTQTHEENKSE